jgi:hypothetical protein
LLRNSNRSRGGALYAKWPISAILREKRGG